MAADLAFKAALPEIQPTILEPILHLTESVKESYVGDVMGEGDMNKVESYPRYGPSRWLYCN